MGFLTIIRQHKALLVLIVLYLLVASWRLNAIPAGLNQDEVAFGLNAYTVSETLADQNGRFLPTYFLTLEGADWKQPVLVYWLAPFVKMLGLSIFTIRFGTVLLGTLNIILLYWLLSLIQMKRSVALIGAFLLTTTPLHFMQSRVALDNLSLVTFLFWLIGFAQYEKRRTIGWLVVSLAALGIGFYSYTPARIFMPLYLLVMLAYLAVRRIISKPMVLLSILFFLLFLIPAFVWFNHHPDALTARFAIIGDPALSLSSFLSHYISYLSPLLWWFKADGSLVHSTLHHGIFLWPTALLFLVGIYHVIKRWRSKPLLLIFFIGLLTAPLAVAFTNDLGRGSRMVNVIPFYVIIAALGFAGLGSRLVKIILFGLTFLAASQFLWFYFAKYPAFATIGYNYKDALSTLAGQRDGRTVYYDAELPFGATYIRFYQRVFGLGERNFVKLADTGLSSGDLLVTSRPLIFPQGTVMSTIVSSGIPVALVRF